METVALTAERMAQLKEFAHRRGQDAASALDSALDEYLNWEQRDFQAAIQGVREGYDDLKSGRTQPIDDLFEELRAKHGLPR